MKIFREERLQLILEQLKTNQKVYVDSLAEQFGISTSSIRLDLAELESRGLIARTYGGAILPENKIEAAPAHGTDPWRPELSSRAKENLIEKEAIGKAAAALVEDGDTLMIDGGSTTQYVVKYLVDKRDLTIVTNAISLVPDLLAIRDAEIHLVGGLLQRDNIVLGGDVAIETVSRFFTRKAILGIDGISLDMGLTVSNPSATTVAATKRAMIAASDEFIIVADHTKFGRTCLIPVAPLEAVNYLVTDETAPPQILEEISLIGPAVRIAEL